MVYLKRGLIPILLLSLFCSQNGLAKDIKIGLNYPQTGPYSSIGKAQHNGAILAIEEINNNGGILNRKIQLVIRDTQSKPAVSTKNVLELIDKEGCEMILGGSSGAVAIAGGKIAKSREKLYFGTLTYSNATTGTEGHKYMFRECYNAWMGAKAISNYLMKEKLSSKKFFYITADYTWGRTTEDSIRTFSMTNNENRHRRFYTPFPGATYKDFSNALSMAKVVKPQVLVLVLFGDDMVRALTMLEKMGLKKKFQAILVPNLTLDMASGAGPKVMENVIGAVPWSWNVPFRYNYAKGKQFVEEYAEKYQSYPSSAAGSAYTSLHQYKEAVERAGTFNTRTVIEALENHKYVSLKDEQQWRAFDHQSVQTVHVVVCKKAEEVQKDKFKQDYFEIIDTLSGEEAARSKTFWQQLRKVAGKTPELEY
ncbi:MAG: ABC transporter substrate-binding protein [Desulfobacterales bacterium]|nr:ABC transporter substrate-binding protein [Desulfobacterales bacterium]